MSLPSGVNSANSAANLDFALQGTSQQIDLTALYLSIYCTWIEIRAAKIQQILYSSLVVVNLLSICSRRHDLAELALNTEMMDVYSLSGTNTRPR